jgi:probable F420-dependent oxidoreductase
VTGDLPALGRFGVWSAELRVGDPVVLGAVAAELTRLGYGTLWLPCRTDDLFDVADAYLEAADDLVVASGVASIWNYEAAAAAAGTARLTARHGERFLLGLGVSHSPLVNNERAAPYRKPLALMEHYLDELDQAGPGTPTVIAALGPRMLELAGRRSHGTHPYLVTPAHTALARQSLGPDQMVAVCQTATIESDPAQARAVLRQELSTYMRLPNYVNNWRRLGFGEDDFSDGGSNRLIDSVFVWGSAADVAARMREHLHAGASHVCIKAVGGDGTQPPIAQWRMVAEALRD